MRTPIPDVRQITSLTAGQSGYQLKFEDGGLPDELTLSKDYVIARILTKAPDRTIDEHREYSSSPQGLLLIGQDLTSPAPDGTLTHVAFDLSYQTVDTLEFPQNIHFVVGDFINIKFSLQNCSAVRGTVIKVGPPK